MHLADLRPQVGFTVYGRILSIESVGSYRLAIGKALS